MRINPLIRKYVYHTFKKAWSLTADPLTSWMTLMWTLCPHQGRLNGHFSRVFLANILGSFLKPHTP